MFGGLSLNLTTHMDTHIFCRTPLDEGSALRRDLYLTSNNTHKRHTSITPAGFEPATPASEWPQTHALDREANVIGVGRHKPKLSRISLFFLCQ